jgi:hypothetical protein
MPNKQIKLLLTPQGRFNPKLQTLNATRAEESAVTLVKKLAKTNANNLDTRLSLITLIEQLQTTKDLTDELYTSIREAIQNTTNSTKK